MRILGLMLLSKDLQWCSKSPNIDKDILYWAIQKVCHSLGGAGGLAKKITECDVGGGGLRQRVMSGGVKGEWGLSVT